MQRELPPAAYNLLGSCFTTKAWSVVGSSTRSKRVPLSLRRKGYRRWNSYSGGVLVPVTETSPPNPYLKVPDRDLITRSGIKLIKMNPAYMTRQVHELAAQTYGIQGHICYCIRSPRPYGK